MRPQVSLPISLWGRNVICRYMDYFDWDTVNFCICEDIFCGMAADDSERTYGYTKSLILVKYRRGEEPSYEKVFFDDILPDFREGTWMDTFIPMYIKGRTIGYVWIPVESVSRMVHVSWVQMSVSYAALFSAQR